MKKIAVVTALASALTLGSLGTAQAYQAGGGNHCFSHTISGALTCLVHLNGGMYIYQYDDDGWSWIGGF
ncbi:MAG: hypothetical protein RLO50_22495 [Azospirillaceae bacterium]